VPLLVLYEISVVAVWIFGRKKLSYASREAAGGDAEEDQPTENPEEEN